MELNAVLVLDQVTFRYPGAAAPALDRVSLTVAGGDAVALVGPNGAGKTTLTRLAMALLHPDSGRVVSAGRETAGRAPEDLAGAVGYLFQEPESQLFERTVRAEIAFGPTRLGWSAERVRTSVAAVLDRLELTGVADHHPYDLPVPRRRVVALAAAMVVGPRPLLLDEPTAGLDRGTRALVQAVVRDQAADGVAVLAVTHDPEFAAEALTSAVLLRDGRIADQGPLAEVLSRGSGDRLPLPPYARLVRSLGLSPAGPRLADAAAVLAMHCRSPG